MSIHTFLMGLLATGTCVLVLLLLSRRWPLAEQIALAVAALFMLYVGVDSLIWSIDDVRGGRLVELARSGSSIVVRSAQHPILFLGAALLRLAACGFLIYLALLTLRHAVKRG